MVKEKDKGKKRKDMGDIEGGKNPKRSKNKYEKKRNKGKQSM